MARTFRRTPSSQEDYIKSLDPLLQLRRPQSYAVGSDVGNRSFRVPGTRGIGSQLPGGEVSPQFAQFAPEFQASPMTPVPQSQPRPTDAASFLNRIAYTNKIQNEGVQTLQDGGVLLYDGSIVYPDGYIRRGDPGAYPVQQLVDGSIKYSDGSVKQPTQFADIGQFQNTVFGGQFPITQAYGNINPIEPTPGNVNLGTDYGVPQGTPLLNPFAGARVVDVKYDDGQRFGQHQGYGNSVMIQLADGQMLRFSHLRDAPAFGVGDMLQGGELLGVSGQTGNATGPHVDLEYYNPQGQIDNIDNFFSTYKAPEKRQSQEVRPEPKREQQRQTQLPPVQQTSVPQQQPGDILGTQDVRQPTPEITPRSPYTQAVTGAAEGLANTANKFGINTPELNIGEYGRGEAGAGDVLSAGIAAAGSAVGAKDRGYSEIASAFSPQISEYLSNAAKSIGIGPSLAGNIYNKVMEGLPKIDRVYADSSSNVNQRASDNLSQQFSGLPKSQSVLTDTTRDNIGVPSASQAGNELAARGPVRMAGDTGVQSEGTVLGTSDQQPTPPQSDLQTRIADLASQGKTTANSKKAAKLIKRQNELEGSGKDTSQATSTGYLNPSEEAKAKVENAVKQAFYSAGYGDSYDKFLQKTGNVSKNIQEQGKAVSGLFTSPETRKSFQRGLEDTVTNLGINKPGTTGYKILQGAAAVQSAGQDAFNKGKQAVDVFNRTRGGVQDYVAGILPYSVVQRATDLEKKLKKVFKR